MQLVGWCCPARQDDGCPKSSVAEAVWRERGQRENSFLDFHVVPSWLSLIGNMKLHHPRAEKT